MSVAAAEIIAALHLSPLPGEGGFVRQTWHSEGGSAAYYLMTAVDFSALHRLRSDEVWHFYAGDPVEHIMLDPAKGRMIVTRLGANLAAGERPQVVVPRGVWQGARPVGAQTGWSLIGCTVTPAWNEHDCEIGRREALRREFPDAAAWVQALTRAA